MTDPDGDQHERTAIELVSCPECGNVATIEWASRLSGVPHVKVRCLERHWFLMPAERITCYGSERPYRDADAPAGCSSARSLPVPDRTDHRTGSGPRLQP